MACLLQSTTSLFIFSITLILIPNRHAISFIVLDTLFPSLYYTLFLGLHVFGGLLEDHISMPMSEHMLEMNSDTVVI
ncbi:hypothetical protein ES319_A08G068700v1 [Gossypium barbadense]|uniref:Uncharacterized protein n=1 Tax=Gossypium barbadense TaxID=3634 RepID=A0A5J5UPZ7_GOSBA|nr:hypothetical protein ES319_A08G068700v1 [Gossypium barbadense]